ncbi:MAG: hypothetical protein Q9174_004976 [Haloplaca sp. 1 TL-2023]
MSLIQRKLARAKALASRAKRQANRVMDFVELNMKTEPRFDIDAASMYPAELPRYSLRDRPSDAARQSQPPPPKRIPSLPRQLWLMNPDPPSAVENEGTHQWLDELHDPLRPRGPSRMQHGRYVLYHPPQRVPPFGERLNLDIAFLEEDHQAPIGELPSLGTGNLAAAELEADPVDDIHHFLSSLGKRKFDHVETDNRRELFFNVGADLTNEFMGQMQDALPSAGTADLAVAELEAVPIQNAGHYPSDLPDMQVDHVKTGRQDDPFFNVGANPVENSRGEVQVSVPCTGGWRDQRQVPSFQLQRLTVHTAEWRDLNHEFPRELALLREGIVE